MSLYIIGQKERVLVQNNKIHSSK